MQLPLQITFRGMEPSAAVEARIRERVERLDRFHSRITSCRVVVESPHRHHHQGRLFHVRIDVTVPQHEIVVNRDPTDKHASEDVFVAIRDAFEAVQRQLESYARKDRGEIKTHNDVSLAHVSQLAQDKGFGYLTTEDGREVYFHRNSVSPPGFDTLRVGTPVRYREEPGEKGPRAVSVHTL